MYTQRIYISEMKNLTNLYFSIDCDRYGRVHFLQATKILRRRIIPSVIEKYPDLFSNNPRSAAYQSVLPSVILYYMNLHVRMCVIFETMETIISEAKIINQK